MAFLRSLIGWSLIIIGLLTILAGGIGLLFLIAGYLVLNPGTTIALPVTVVPPATLEAGTVEEKEIPAPQCSNCGKTLEFESTFCPSCGTRQ